MQYSIFLLVAGALFTTLLTPLSIRAARLLGALDLPDGVRHLHPYPTPRLGGLAPVASSVLITLAFVHLDPTVAAWLSGGILLASLGVTDDLYTLSPIPKLSAMLAICALPAAFGLAPDALSLGSLTLPLSFPLGNLFSLFWTLLLVNAWNLIDGSDGLSAVLALVGGLSLYLAGGHAVALLLCGTALGFLPYNLPLRTPFWQSARAKTRSFLGDTGALFLGYSLAVLSLEKKAFFLSIPLFFALPVFDLVRVFFQRLLQRKNPFRADRSHLHHKLAARGFTAGQILVLCTLYALLIACIGLVLPVVWN